MQLEQAGGPSAVARTDLGSCRLGKVYIWEVATSEKSFGKVPTATVFLKSKKVGIAEQI